MAIRNRMPLMKGNDQNNSETPSNRFSDPRHRNRGDRVGRSRMQQKTEPQTLLMYVIDGSGSTNKRDYPPTRFEAAMQLTLKSVGVRAKRDPSSLVAVGTFNEVGHTVLPFTPVSEHQAIKTALENDCPPPAGGTFISAGLETMERLLMNTDYPYSRKRLYLLSDGVCYLYDGLEVAARLKSRGVEITCVGIGGSPSDVNEGLLREIASTNAQGEKLYFFARDYTELDETMMKFASCVRS